MSTDRAMPAPIDTVELFPARLVLSQYDPALPDAFQRCMDALSELGTAGAVADLDQLSRLITRTYLPGAVQTARDYGTPWAEIGKQLGSSRQAAQQRFS